MTTEQQEREQEKGRAISEGVVRLRRLWPHQLDGPEVIGEYRRVLGKATDAVVVRLVVDRVIDEAGDGYLPRPGVFVTAIREATARRRREVDSTRITDRWVDESALRDALAYLETCPEDERAWAEKQVASIRMRLPDRGVHAEEDRPRWERGRNSPTDPPGAVRLRRVEPDDAADEPFPRGPLNGGSR